MIRNCYRLGLSSLLVVACALPAAAQDRWEKDIAAFEAADLVSPPPGVTALNDRHRVG